MTIKIEKLAENWLMIGDDVYNMSYVYNIHIYYVKFVKSNEFPVHFRRENEHNTLINSFDFKTEQEAQDFIKEIFSVLNKPMGEEQ